MLSNNSNPNTASPYSSSEWDEHREATLVRSINDLYPSNHSRDSLSHLISHVATRARISAGELRIGMYDGSFDPPHYGHIEVAHAAKAFARLDLLVINCHHNSNHLKPNLTHHSIRHNMLSSYFPQSEGIIVSPLTRGDIEAIIRPCKVVGIIGSDTFNRFLRDGIAPDFITDEIFVAERHTDLLREAPHTLHGRPVLYAGAATLAYNHDSSSIVKGFLRQHECGTPHPLLNEPTNRLIQSHRLYIHSGTVTNPAKSPTHTAVEMNERCVPTQYKGCTVMKRLGLHNGLLSESSVHEVRDPSGDVVAFMKQIPQHRDPANMISDEGSGLAIFNTLGLTNAKAPSFQITSEPPTLWVEKVPGKTLSALITGYDRGEESEEDVYRVIYAVGELLGSIHRRHQQSFNQNAINLLKGHIAHHEELLAKASNRQLMNLDLQETTRVFREKASQLLSEGVLCSLLHGDANPGNFLWDNESEQLSVIDLQRLGTQVRTGGTGFPTLEFFSFLRTLYHFPNIGFEGRRGGLHDAVAIYREAYGTVNENEERMFEAMWHIRKNLAGNVRIHGISPVPG